MTDTIPHHVMGAYSSIIYVRGQTVIAEDSSGLTILSGVAGTDDATVWQAACSRGGLVVATRYNYCVRSSIVLDVPFTCVVGLTIPPSIVSLSAESKQVTIRVPDGATFPTFRITRSNISVQGLNFEDNYIPIVVVPEVTTMFGLFIEKCSFYNSIIKAIDVDSSTFSVVGPVIIKQNVFYSLARGSESYVNITCVHPMTKLYIENNVFESHATNYINFSVSGVLEIMSLRDNYMESSTPSENFYNFHVSGAAYLSIFGDISGKIGGVPGDRALNMVLDDTSQVMWSGKISNLRVGNSSIFVTIAPGCYVIGGPCIDHVISSGLCEISISGVAIGASVIQSKIGNMKITGARGVHVCENIHADGSIFTLTNDAGVVVRDNFPYSGATPATIDTTGSTGVSV